MESTKVKEAKKFKAETKKRKVFDSEEDEKGNKLNKQNKKQKS